MSEHTELTRFWSNGKTFFLNRGLAKNGAPYLAINALYGKGNRERIVLYEGHWMQFKRHLELAIEKLTGLKPADQVEQETPKGPECPEQCPNCSWYLRDPEQNQRIGPR